MVENYLATLSKEKEEEEKEERLVLTGELQDKILAVLSECFGIMASIILEESIKDWELSGGSYEELVEIIASHADTPKEEEEIKSKLMFL